MRRRNCWTVARAFLVCLLVAGIAHGQTKRGWKKTWIVSVGALIAVNVLDACSSQGVMKPTRCCAIPKNGSMSGAP